LKLYFCQEETGFKSQNYFSPDLDKGDEIVQAVSRTRLDLELQIFWSNDAEKVSAEQGDQMRLWKSAQNGAQ
jgi:hypothetical protein